MSAAGDGVIARLGKGVHRASAETGGRARIAWIITVKPFWQRKAFGKANRAPPTGPQAAIGMDRHAEPRLVDRLPRISPADERLIRRPAKGEESDAAKPVGKR